MKHILQFVIVLCLLPFAVQGQMTQIPNASFEEEDTLDYPKPEGWWDSHNIWAIPNGPGFPFTTDQTFLESFDGNFSQRLETKEGLVFGFFSKYVPGIMTNGTPFLPSTATTLAGLSIDETFVKGGVAWTDTPAVFYGQYQYTPVMGDSAWAYIKFWDAAGTIVGEGEWSTTDATADWTRFQVDITYTGTPDSMLLIVSSSANATLEHVGSTLFLDSVGFTYDAVNGLGTPDYIDLSVYPNPATDLITLVNPFQGKAVIEIFDANGRLVRERNAVAGANSFELSDMTQGTYFAIIRSEGDAARATFQVR